MKKTMMLLLSVVLALQGAMALSACGSEEASKEEKGTVAVSQTSKSASATAPSTTAPQTTAAATTQKPTDAPKQSSAAKQSSVAPKQSSQNVQTNQNNNAQTQNNSNQNNTPQNNTPQNNTPQNNTPQNNTPQNNTPQNNTPAPQQQKPVGSFEASDLTFRFNGKSVVLDEDMNSVLSKLGNANNVFSAPSCHGDGEDKTYEYNGFTVYTYPSGNKNLVLEITVEEPGLSTQKGVSVGSSVDDMVAAYGDGYSVSGNHYIYANGAKSLQFFVSGDTVTAIDYYYDF